MAFDRMVPVEITFWIVIWLLCFGVADAKPTFNSPTTTSVDENSDGIVPLWYLDVTCHPRDKLNGEGGTVEIDLDCSSSCTISPINYEPGLFEISGNILKKKACSDTSCGSCPSCDPCTSADGCINSGEEYTISIYCATSDYHVNDRGTESMKMTVTSETPTLSIALPSPVPANNNMSVDDVVTTATETSGLTITDWEEEQSVADSYILETSKLFVLDTDSGEIIVNKELSVEYSFSFTMGVCVYSRRQKDCADTTINFSGCFQTPECSDQTGNFSDTHAVGETLFVMSVADPSAHFSTISATWQDLAFTQDSTTLDVTSVDPDTGSITTTGNLTVFPIYPSITYTTVVRVSNSDSCYNTTCTLTYTVFFTNWPINITNDVTTTSIHEDFDVSTTLFNVTTEDANDPSQDNVTCSLDTDDTDLFELVHDGFNDHDSYSIVKKTCLDPGCGFLCDLNRGCLNWNLTSSYSLDVTCEDAYGSSDTKTFTVTVDRNEKFTWRNLPKTITVNSDTVAHWDVLFSVLYSDAEGETLTYNYTVSPAQPSPPLFSFDSQGNYYDNPANVTSLTYQWDSTNITYTVTICGWERRNLQCEDLTIDIRDFCGPMPTCSTDYVSVTDQFQVGDPLFNITVPSSGVFTGLSYAITTENTGLFNVDPDTGEVTSLAALSVKNPPANTQYTVVGLVYDTAACGYGSCELLVDVNFTNFPISIDNMAPGAVTVDVHEDTTSAVTLHTIATSDNNNDDTVSCIVDDALSEPANNGIFYTEETDTHSGVFMINSKEGPGFDYDVTQSYTIAVVCSDSYGSSDNANMTVNILENQPPNMTNLDNNTIVNVDPLTKFSGEIIFTLQTSDAENDLLTYSCSVDNTWVPLECLSDGVVSLRRNVRVPDENGTIYTILICIYETVHSHTLCNELQVNFTTSKTHPVIDNLPATVYLDEDASVGTTLYSVTVQDPDAGETHTFSMKTSPESSASTFSLDTSTGAIKLAAVLDYETLNQYTFTVSVSDPYLTSLEDQKLFLYINNVNEAPVLVIGDTSFNTTEGSAGRHIRVLDFSCSDPDISESLTFGITSGAYRNYFSLNSLSGVMTHALAWDFESGSSFPASTNITVSCYDDEGLSSTATLTISIATVNEFAPVLNTVAENITIYSNQSLIESLLSVSATDADYGHDGNFSYSIVGIGHGAEFFTMTENGQLMLAQYITLAYNFTYEFTILVSDDESDPLTSSIYVIVTYLAPDTTEPTKPTPCTLCWTEGIVVVAALGVECLVIITCMIHICIRMKAYSIFQDKSLESTGVRRRKTKISDLRWELESNSSDEEHELADIKENDKEEPTTKRGIRTISDLAPQVVASRAPRNIPRLFNDDVPPADTRPRRPESAAIFARGNRRPPLSHLPSTQRGQGDSRTSLYEMGVDVISPPLSVHPSSTGYPSPVWEPPGHVAGSTGSLPEHGLDF